VHTEKFHKVDTKVGSKPRYYKTWLLFIMVFVRF